MPGPLVITNVSKKAIRRLLEEDAYRADTKQAIKNLDGLDVLQRCKKLNAFLKKVSTNHPRHTLFPFPRCMRYSLESSGGKREWNRGRKGWEGATEEENGQGGKVSLNWNAKEGKLYQGPGKEG
jgi:hypothetical protein